MDNIAKVFLGKDIVLDQEAFERSARELDDLTSRIEKLKNNISEMLGNIQRGLDTPAGRKLVESCQNKLMGPLENQKLVIGNVSQTLGICRSKYESVFTGYTELNNTIKSLGN